MKLPKPLTVAIPTYNGARHLPDALRGILAQEGAAFDLLICDDRSDDNTLAIVRAAASDRARIVLNSERLGLAGNWNRCVAQSQTPLIAIFHQDDMMRPGHLAAHLTTFETHPHIGMVCGAADVVDEQGQAVPPSMIERADLGPTDRIFPAGAFVVELATRNPVRCSGVTIRKEAHTDVGGFNPALRYVVDWDFWLRLARRWPVAWQARPTVAVRWHPGSETYRFKVGTDDLDEVVRLLDELFIRDRELLPRPHQWRRRSHRELARAYLNRAYDAARGHQPGLVRLALRRAFTLWPAIVLRLMFQPRLLARLGAAGLVIDRTRPQDDSR